MAEYSLDKTYAKWDENKKYPFDDYIKETATKYGLPPEIFRKQLHRESYFDPNAISPVGAVGVGQIMPSTAKSYGVEDVGKLKDPYFNIDLAGRIMQDNLRISKGDINAALAQYNQGTKGRKAYQEGRYGDLPKETFNYIDALGDENKWGGKPVANISDVTTTPNTVEKGERHFLNDPILYTDNNIPEVEGKDVSSEATSKEAIREALSNTSRQTLLGTGFRTKRWADASGVYDPATDSINAPEVGFFEGLKHSWAAQAVQMAWADGNITSRQFIPNTTQSSDILRRVGYNEDRYFAVINGASSMEDIEERIKINDEHIKYLEAESKAGLPSSLLSGVGKMVTDPLSYVPFVGGASLAGRVAVGAGMGALSNQLDTYVSGAENDLMEDLVAGGLVGLGAELLFRGAGKSAKYIASSGKRAEIIRQYQVAGQDLPSEVFEGIGGSTKLAVSLNNLRDSIDRRLPVVSVLGVLKRAHSAELKDFTNKVLVDRGSGFVGADGKTVATEFQGLTAAERLRDARIDKDNFELSYNDSMEKLRLLGYDRDSVETTLIGYVEEGIDTPLASVQEFRELATNYQNALSKLSITGQVGGYVPRIIDTTKVDDLFDPSIRRSESRDALINDVAESLVDDFDKNPTTNKNVTEYYKKHVYEPEVKKREEEIKAYNEQRAKTLQAQSDKANKEISEKAVQESALIEDIKAQREQDLLEAQQRYDAIEPDLQKNIQSLDDKLDDSIDDLDEAFRKESAKISKAYAKDLEKVNDDISKLDPDKDKAIQKVKSEYKKKREDREKKYTEDLAKAKTDKRKEYLRKQKEKFLDTLETREENALESINKSFKAKRERLVKKRETLKDTLEKKKESLNNKLDRDINKLETSINKAKKDLTKKADRERKDILKEMDKLSNRAELDIKSARTRISKAQSKHHIQSNKVATAVKYQHAPEPLPPEPSPVQVREWVIREARGDVTGWIDQGKSQSTNAFCEGTMMRYDPNVSRIPWGTATTSRKGISINKLRKNPLDSYKMLVDKVTGDQIIRSLGYNNIDELDKALENMIINEMNNYVGQGITAEQLRAVKEQLKNSFYNKYGRAGGDINSGWFAAMCDVIRNITFFSKNALMGVANLFEQGEAIKHYGAYQFVKGVPLVRNLFDNWTKGGMTHEEARQAQSLIFGLSVRQLGLYKDIARESYEKQLTRFHGDKKKAILVSATDALAQASPFTRFLQNTENSIVEASQGMFLGELIHFAHTGKKHLKKGFLNRDTLARNGISEANYQSLLRVLRETTSIGPDGKINIDDLNGLLSKDPGALATLRRLGDYVSNEVIQKNTLGDAFLWEGSHKNPFLQLMFQFKTFAIRSYDKRIRKMMNRAAEGDALGQAYSLYLSTALGTIGAMANSGIAMMGMNEDQRKNYLKNNYAYTEDEGLTPDVFMRIGINGVMRANVLAMPSMVLSSAGFNSGVKTTGVTDTTVKPDMYKGFDSDEFLQTLAPAYSTVKTGFDIMGYGTNQLKMTMGDEYTEEYKERNREKFAKAVRNGSNIPFLKWGLYNILTDEK